MPKRADLPKERFAELFLAVLDAYGIKKKEAATIAGVDATTISRWVGSWKGPAPGRATRYIIEDQLGLPRNYLSDDPRAVKAADLRVLASHWRNRHFHGLHAPAGDQPASSTSRSSEPEARTETHHASPEQAILLIQGIRLQMDGLCRQMDAAMLALKGL